MSGYLWHHLYTKSPCIITSTLHDNSVTLWKYCLTNNKQNSTVITVINTGTVTLPEAAIIYNQQLNTDTP